MTAIGVPIKILHEAEGHIITMETTIGLFDSFIIYKLMQGLIIFFLILGEVFRGKLVEAEDNMNCQLVNVTLTLRDGRTQTLDNVFVRGSQIRFIILPDMLKNAPMFKNIGRAQKGARGMGLGGEPQRGRGAFRGRGGARGGIPQRGTGAPRPPFRG